VVTGEACSDCCKYEKPLKEIKERVLSNKTLLQVVY